MTTQRDGARTDRREFLAQSATSMGALALGSVCASGSPLGANERIRLGILGAGNRGGTLMSWAHKLESEHNVRLTAVCDLWEKRREAAARRIEEWNGRPPSICRTPRELFDRSDVDAVLIATADFQHCYHAAMAVQAGKDVYVERPFGCDFEQVRRSADIIRQSDRIVQMGTQSRGSDIYYAAAKFVQSGKLGQVTYVEISEPIFQQRWRVTDSVSSPRSEEIDWKEYLAYLPPSLAFDSRSFREFRLFWPFSSGPFCQWMSHRIDLVNLVLGKLPTAAVSLGGVYLWKDGRTNPDTVQCLLEYPGGVMATYHMRMGNSHNGRGITFYGTNGTLELDSGTAYGNGGGGLVVEAERTGGIQNYRIDKTRLLRDRKDGGVLLGPAGSIDYLGHFFENLRSRSRPRGDVESGYGHSVATILANMAYRHSCKMVYDPIRREMRRADPLHGSPGLNPFA